MQLTLWQIIPTYATSFGSLKIAKIHKRSGDKFYLERFSFNHFQRRSKRLLDGKMGDSIIVSRRLGSFVTR